MCNCAFRLNVRFIVGISFYPLVLLGLGSRFSDWLIFILLCLVLFIISFLWSEQSGFQIVHDNLPIHQRRRIVYMSIVMKQKKTIVFE
ncbi:hypothetical protein RJT34_18183 [Clitoria ternatea]|uniref:Uncharacterized protein n=1 Tax=Clitoria ternatea TaxID=43366 RepID=A0AAN9PFK3_CLITE